MSDVGNVAQAQLFVTVRRPAVWTVFAAAAVLNQVFSYLVPYLSYRSSGGSGFRASETPAELLASTLPDQIVPNTVGGFPIFAGALALAFGALFFGSDHGWGTTKTLLTQRPSRRSALLGQLAALAVCVVSAVIALYALSAVSSTVIALSEGSDIAFPSATHVLSGVGSGALILATWAVVGGSLSLALRGVALPIGLGIVWALGIENIISAMASSVLSGLEPLRDLLPGVNAGSLVAAISPERVGEAAPGVSASVGAGRAVGTLLVYVALSVVLAAWSSRRDVT